MALRSKNRITKTDVDRLQPGDAIWDSEIKGFGCRCQIKGKFYILKYRNKQGRQRWHVIGEHGSPWTADKARREALDKKNYIAKGGDPSADKENKRKEKTITELADRYLKEHALPHNKPSTITEIKRIIEKRIKPELGKLKITELTRADIKCWHQDMSGTPTEANRALAYCSKMLSLAAHEWEFRSDNPCIGIKRFPEKPRERFFSHEELQRLGNALSKAEGEKTELTGFTMLIRLLATTGMRLGEGLALRWEYVDLPGRVIRLPDTKAGARAVHLSAEAVALLDTIKQGEGFVFTRLDGRTALTPGIADKAWRRIREKAKIPDGRIHDLRHTVGTYAALGGANAFAVRDLLGHKTLTMSNRYVSRAAEMVRGTVDSVADRVVAAMQAKGKSAEIVQMPALRA